MSLSFLLHNARCGVILESAIQQIVDTVPANGVTWPKFLPSQYPRISHAKNHASALLTPVMWTVKESWSKPCAILRAWIPLQTAVRSNYFPSMCGRASA